MVLYDLTLACTPTRKIYSATIDHHSLTTKTHTRTAHARDPDTDTQQKTPVRQTRPGPRLMYGTGCFHYVYVSPWSIALVDRFLTRIHTSGAAERSGGPPLGPRFVASQAFMRIKVSNLPLDLGSFRPRVRREARSTRSASRGGQVEHLNVGIGS